MITTFQVPYLRQVAIVLGSTDRGPIGLTKVLLGSSGGEILSSKSVVLILLLVQNYYVEFYIKRNSGKSTISGGL